MDAGLKSWRRIGHCGGKVILVAARCTKPIPDVTKPVPGTEHCKCCASSFTGEFQGSEWVGFCSADRDPPSDRIGEQNELPKLNRQVPSLRICFETLVLDGFDGSNEFSRVLLAPEDESYFTRLLHFLRRQ